jgi:hypothetical protein
MTLVIGPFQISWSKVKSEMKSKQQSPCSKCMHWPVTSWGNACSMYMHRPVTSQADTCTYYMGSKVSRLSQIYLYSSYFGTFNDCLFQGLYCNFFIVINTMKVSVFVSVISFHHHSNFCTQGWNTFKVTNGRGLR